MKEKYITDSQGNRLGVFLDIEEYQYLLEQLEELEELKAYDTAKQSEDEVIPFEQAIFNLGQGDYTIERQEQLDKFTPEDIFRDIEQHS